jgi:hypothetical protein
VSDAQGSITFPAVMRQSVYRDIPQGLSDAPSVAKRNGLTLYEGRGNLRIIPYVFEFLEELCRDAPLVERSRIEKADLAGVSDWQATVI